MKTKSNRLIIACRHFTANSGSYAGAIEEISKYAHSMDYDVNILCGQVSKSLPIKQDLGYAKIIRFQVSEKTLPLLGMNQQYIQLANQISRYLKKNPPKGADLLIANSRAALGFKGYRYIIRIGQPAFTFLKNMEIAKDKVSLITRIGRAAHFFFQSLLEKKSLFGAYGIITSSRKNKNNLNKYYPVGKIPYMIPHSGIRKKELSGGKKIVPGKNILFVSAGKEKIRKGVIYLEQALPIFFSRHPMYRLLHVGEKFDWNIEEKYKKNVISVGRVDWNIMKDYYASSEFLAVCSLNEWIPNVIYEAMAAGCPVLTSDLDGVDEIISHKSSGYIYKRGDISGLIGGLEWMAKNKKNRKVFSEKGKKTVKDMDYSNFSKEVIEFAKRPMEKSLIK